MRKRTFFIILAALCFIAAAVLVIVGVKQSSHSAIKEGLVSVGAVTLTYDESSTMSYMDSKNARPADPNEEQDAAYTVVFTANHPQYGLIRYDLGVDTKTEFDELTAANADLVFTGDVFIEPDENAHALRKSTKEVYVYAWPKTEEESRNTPEGENSRYNFKFEDRIRDLYEISEEIDPSPKVSSTRYFIIAAIPLLGGAYLLFLAFAGPRGKAAER
jgi:hypothetical protein